MKLALLGLIALNLAGAVAQTPSPGNDFTDLLPYLNTGVLGALVLALLRRWLVLGWTYDGAVAENVQLKTDLKALRDSVMADVLVPMSRQIDVLTELAEKQVAANAKGTPRSPR